MLARQESLGPFGIAEAHASFQVSNLAVCVGDVIGSSLIPGMVETFPADWAVNSVWKSGEKAGSRSGCTRSATLLKGKS